MNLAEVRYIDSAGLGELVAAYATVTRAGGQIKLVNTESRIKDVLQITKLGTVFELCSNEAAALKSFAAASASA
jgi:anti-sigma B factor antagonist